jgi:cellobiose phosphorylase
MVNTWNPYQCMVRKPVAVGVDVRVEDRPGHGLRDSARDLLGFVHMVGTGPSGSRYRRDPAPDGGAYHQYQPLTKRGNHDIGGGFNDDPLWLVLAVAAYSETGDAAILDEPVTGTTPAPRRRSRPPAPCIGFTLDRLGPTELP